MANTTNYSLPLPQLGEPADIRVLDQGTEMIDGIMHGNRTMIAPGWVSTETYNTGNRVVYLGEYYKCKADNVTGAWDATKWDKTTVGEDIEGLGTGGASALADLDDVEITSPTEGQALLYDDEDDKWKNGTLPDPSVVKEVTGNPIEITDAASAPLVKCVTDITGSQDLHGYDKPWVGGAGKNKISDGTDTTNGYVADSYLLMDGTTVAYYPDTEYVSEYFPVLPNTVYTASNSVGLNNAGFCFYDSAYNYIIGYRFEGSPSKTVTTPANAAYCRCTQYYSGYISSGNYVQFELGSQATSYSPYSNICPITAYTEGVIEVRGKNVFDSSLMVNVIGTVQWIQIVLTPNTTYTVSSNIPYSSTSSFIFAVSGTDTTGATSANSGVGSTQSRTLTTGTDGIISFGYRNTSAEYGVKTLSDFVYQIEKGGTATAYEPYTSTTHTTTFPSAIYRGSEDVVKGEVTANSIKVLYNSSSGWTYDSSRPGVFSRNMSNDSIIYDKSNISGFKSNEYEVVGVDGWVLAANDKVSVYKNPGSSYYLYLKPNGGTMTSLSDLETFLTANPLEIVIPLETPTTTPVTPTNLPIKSLSGYNHIESSTGDMEVEYISGNYQALVDLIQSSSHVYSTAEQVVGKWTDGKDIYEKTFELQSEVTLTANQWNSITGVSLSGVETPIDAEIRGSSGTSVANVDFMDSPVSVWGTSGTEKVKSITFRYTKSTSNRSLSAPVNTQKAQIEPLTDKTEEVPTEEEKAVETPVEKPETEEENDER